MKIETFQEQLQIRETVSMESQSERRGINEQSDIAYSLITVETENQTQRFGRIRNDYRPYTASSETAPLEISPHRDSPHKIRVMLVDDHKIVRQGFIGLLGDEEDIEVVGEASDGMMAVELARRIHPDVIIMDVSMPRMNGIEATQHIVSEQPDVRIIGLSMHDLDEMAMTMQKAGAVAYFCKGGPSSIILAAIRGLNS